MEPLNGLEIIGTVVIYIGILIVWFLAVYGAVSLYEDFFRRGDNNG